MTIRTCERGFGGSWDLDSVTTNHDRLEDGDTSVSRFDLATDHVKSAVANVKSAAGHAAGTVAVPIAVASMAPALLVPYANLFVAGAMYVGANYAVRAPLFAFGELGDAAHHVKMAVAVGLTGPNKAHALPATV